MAAIEEALGECGIAEFVVDHIHGVGDAASHERVQDMLGDFDTEILRGSPPCGLAHALRVDKGAVHVEDDCLHMWVLSGNCLGSMVSGRGAVHVWRECAVSERYRKGVFLQQLAVGTDVERIGDAREQQVADHHHGEDAEERTRQRH